MLKKNIKMNEKIVEQRNKQVLLEQTINYKDTLDNLVKDKDIANQQLITATNEVDKLNNDVIINYFIFYNFFF